MAGNVWVAIDLDDGRLELAKKLGAEASFNAKTEGLAQTLREYFGGDGADASFEVVGAGQPIDLAIRSVRKNGQVILVGNLQPNTPFPLQEVVTRQLTLRGSCSCAGEYPEAIRRIEDGSIQVLPLLSITAALDEGAQWFHKATQPGEWTAQSRPRRLEDAAVIRPQAPTLEYGAGAPAGCRGRGNESQLRVRALRIDPGTRYLVPYLGRRSRAVFQGRESILQASAQVPSVPLVTPSWDWAFSSRQRPSPSRAPLRSCWYWRRVWAASSWVSSKSSTR